MLSSTRLANENQELPDIKKVIIIFLSVSIVVFAIVLVGMTLTKPAQDGNPTTLAIVLYQSVPYSNNGTNYEFKYEPAGEAGVLIVSSEGQSLNFPAVAGVTHEELGLKIMIISVTQQGDQQLIVVQVSPLEK